MTKALIIDDEVRATDALRLMIEKFVPQIERVEVCNDARNAATIIHNLKPDLVFLDIRMPHLSGFDVLNKLPSRNFRIIFTTAYDEYAIQAIRFSAFDYLLKPIDAEDLINCVKRFFAVNEVSFQEELLGNVMLNLQSPGQFRLALPTREGIHYIFPNELARCEALGNYTRFFTTDGKQLLISKTLADYDEILSPYGFIRTHKSHLVNIHFISYVDHEGYVVLKDSTRVEIARRRKEQVLKTLAG